MTGLKEAMEAYAAKVVYIKNLQDLVEEKDKIITSINEEYRGAWIKAEALKKFFDIYPETIFISEKYKDEFRLLLEAKGILNG